MALKENVVVYTLVRMSRAFSVPSHDPFTSEPQDPCGLPKLANFHYKTTLMYFLKRDSIRS